MSISAASCNGRKSIPMIEPGCRLQHGRQKRSEDQRGTYIVNQSGGRGNDVKTAAVM